MAVGDVVSKPDELEIIVLYEEKREGYTPIRVLYATNDDEITVEDTSDCDAPDFVLHGSQLNQIFINRLALAYKEA